jgi:hypothetical protein
VNVMIVKMARRADGRYYPSPPLTRAERNSARWLAHRLVCSGRLTYRQAQAVMLERGVSRSLGSIARDLRLFQCPACTLPEPSGPP